MNNGTRHVGKEQFDPEGIGQLLAGGGSLVAAVLARTCKKIVFYTLLQ